MSQCTACTPVSLDPAPGSERVRSQMRSAPVTVSVTVFGVPESDLAQKDVGFLSECVLRYLKDLPSPLIPACIYPQLQTAVSVKQQAQSQAAGRLAEH